MEREKLTFCDPSAVGTVIRRLRMEKEMTQEVLSGLAALSRSALEQIERGTRRPTLETVFRLAYALRMSPSALVAEIEKSTTTETGQKVNRAASHRRSPAPRAGS